MKRKSRLRYSALIAMIGISALALTGCAAGAHSDELNAIDEALSHLPAVENVDPNFWIRRTPGGSDTFCILKVVIDPDATDEQVIDLVTNYWHQDLVTIDVRGEGDNWWPYLVENTLRVNFSDRPGVYLEVSDSLTARNQPNFRDLIRQWVSSHADTSTRI